MFNKFVLRIAKIIGHAKMLLLATCCIGCAGTHIEYIPLDSNLIGKKIRFKEQMVYQVFTDAGVAEKYGFNYPRYENKRITNNLISKSDVADMPGYFRMLQYEIIKKEMVFIIIGNYWVRHDILTREFAPDYKRIILIDEHGALSSYMITGDDVEACLHLYTYCWDH